MRRAFSSAELVAHAQGVRALARTLVGDADAADDVVQDACLAAIERPPEESTPPRAWFVGVVRNLARRTFRSASSRRRREFAAAKPEGVPPSEHVAAEIEAHRRVFDAVTSLAEPYRTAIVLRFFDGLAPREIAARLGVPVGTVNTRIRRGIEKLRERLGDRDDLRAALLPLFAMPRPPHAPASPLVPVTGALAMTAKKWLVALAVLLLVGGTVVGVRAIESHARAARRDAHAASTDAASTARKRHRATAVPADVVAASPASPLPPPVNLDAVDRDRDLHGVVVDMDGKPVAGATVETLTRPWAERHMYDPDEEVVRGPATRSAVDGTFALRLARGESVSLRVSATGCATRELAARSAGERVRVVLGPGVRLIVTVVDETSRPMSGVRFRISRNSYGDESLDRDATTGADGRAVVDDLPGGLTTSIWPHPSATVAMNSMTTTQVQLPARGHVDVEVSARLGRTVTGRVVDADTGAVIVGARVGWGSGYGEVASRADGTFEVTRWDGHADELIDAVAEGRARTRAFTGDGRAVEIRMPRGASVFGRVVDVAGAPIAEALVWTRWSDEKRKPPGYSSGHAVTGDDGRFAILGLEPSVDHTICIEAHGHAQSKQIVAPEVDGADLGDVVLGTPRAIEGSVHLADGSPCARASVQLEFPISKTPNAGSSWLGSGTRYADDLGRFRFPDLAPGRYELYVTPVGAPNVRRHVDLPPDHDVLDVDLTVAASRVITVRVANSAGAPVIGVRVRGGVNAGAASEAYTDADGVARLYVVDGEATIWVMPSIYESSPLFEAEPRKLAPNENDVRIKLDNGVRTTGRVVDPDGKPIAVARLKFEQSGREIWALPTDQDGRFWAIVGPTGAVDISFGGQTGDYFKEKETGLRGMIAGVAPGAQDVELRCSPRTKDHSLRIRVVDRDGKPVAGAEIKGHKEAGVTDADGRITLTGLSSDRISPTVAPRVEGHAFGSFWVTVVPEGQEITLVYREQVIVEGTATFADGRWAVRARATVFRGEAAIGSDLCVGGKFAVVVPADERGPLRVVVDGTDDDGKFEGRADDVASAQRGVRVVLARK